MPYDAAAVDASIRDRRDAGDLDGAVTLAIDTYGDELFGFLIGLTGDHDRAGDVFSETCEKVWKNLAGFRFESSLRVWLYRIARNEFLRVAQRKQRSVPLSAVPAVEAVVVRARSGTPVHQRTEIKEAFAKIREGLSPDDHMLLGLRIEQKLPWNEIAAILGVEAPALRKRFERLKAKLRDLVKVADE